MTIVDNDTVRNLELAREVLSTTDCSIVVVNYGKIWKQKTGEGIKPILETIDEMGEDIKGSVIGDKITGFISIKSLALSSSPRILLISLWILNMAFFFSASLDFIVEILE